MISGVVGSGQGERLTVGSLFSGIGGLDLGLERAGMEVRWQAEVNPYCSRVLAKHWPDVPNLGDVTNIEWETVERVDLICGGFPCQPVSRAGKQLAQADERWLWPEVVRCLRELRPRFAIMENVPGLLVHGMGDVLGDLAALGFDADWESIPAAAVGAPHLRDRVLIVAWSEHGRDVADTGSGWGPFDYVRAGRDATGRRGADVADTNGAGLEERRGTVTVRSQHDPAERGGEALADPECAGLQGRTGSRTRRPQELATPGRERTSRFWVIEPDVGRVAHGVPSRVDRLRALGNAVVPQVAEFVGRALLSSLRVSQGGST